MRDRDDIEGNALDAGDLPVDRLILEVLLDIRDLLLDVDLMDGMDDDSLPQG